MSSVKKAVYEPQRYEQEGANDILATCRKLEQALRAADGNRRVGVTIVACVVSHLPSLYVQNTKILNTNK